MAPPGPHTPHAHPTSSQPILVIPGLDGHPGLLRGVGHRLFPGLAPLYFDHQLDRAEGGLDGLAERALAVADARLGNSSRLLVCGESFGGTVALTIAHRWPARVRGLVLLSTFAAYPSSTAAQRGLRASGVLGQSATRVLLRIAHRAGMYSQLGLRHTAESRHAYLAHPAPDVQAYRAKCALSVHFDARPWLHEIRCPTLVLTGSLDLVVPISAGRELAAGIPNAELHRLRGGHIPHVTHATQAGALIGDWVARLPS